MPQYQYINKSGSPVTFDAPDQATATQTLNSRADRDPASGIRLLSSVSPAPSAPVTQNIQNPVPASYLNTGTLPTPSLPTPTAPAVNQTYVNSLSTNLQNARTTLDTTYKNQLAEIEKRLTESQQKIQDYEALQQEKVLSNVDQLTQPFRQTLENSERERLHVTENFEANQKLTNELDSLLTQGNEIIKRQKEGGGLESIATANLNQTISDVNARAGVVQAVMSARNGQIAQAYQLIDRTAEAITADRQDRLAYYQALNNFYEGQKDREGKNLIELSADKKTYLAAQINLLENDLSRSQENVDYIKKLMEDPSTALTIAQAGVTLNDTPEQVNQKLAKQASVQQRSDLINSMTAKGYKYIAAPGMAGNQPTVTVFDADGNALLFTAPVETQAVQLASGADVLIDKNTGQIIRTIGGGSPGTTSAPSNSPAPLASTQVSDTVKNYASLLSQGLITLSNVPTSIRNSVVAYTTDINKPLSDAAIKEIQQSQSAIANLEALRTTVQNNLQYIGPIAGLQKYNPYSKARQAQAEVDRVRQQVGKTLEGGVLRKEDEEKYKKILAELTDTPETALAKIDSMITTLTRDIDMYKELQADTGRFVPQSKAPTSGVTSSGLKYTVSE